MVKEIFFAEEGSLVIGSTDYTKEVKEITISGGERDVDLVRTHGAGQFYDTKPINMVEVTATTVGRDTDFKQLVWGGKAVASAGSATETYPATELSVLYNLYDISDVSGAQWQFSFASAIAVSVESRLNATDHLEETFTFKCAPKYYKEQYSSDRVTVPIVT